LSLLSGLIVCNQGKRSYQVFLTRGGQHRSEVDGSSGEKITYILLSSYMANAIPCRVVQLGPSDLVELQEKLKPGLPRTSGLRASAGNILEGCVEGNFYTDG